MAYVSRHLHLTKKINVYIWEMPFQPFSYLQRLAMRFVSRFVHGTIIQLENLILLSIIQKSLPSWKPVTSCQILRLSPSYSILPFSEYVRWCVCISRRGRFMPDYFLWFPSPSLGRGCLSSTRLILRILYSVHAFFNFHSWPDILSFHALSYVHVCIIN